MREQRKSAARERLRAIIRPGDTIYTQAKSRAANYQVLDVWSAEHKLITLDVCTAAGYRLDKMHSGLGIGGAIDPGAEIAKRLGSVLFGDDKSLANRQFVGQTKSDWQPALKTGPPPSTHAIKKG